MCELKVIINNEVVFENAVFAKEIGNNVLVNDVMGKSMEFKNQKITEVNITNEQLTLTSTA